MARHAFPSTSCAEPARAARLVCRLSCAWLLAAAPLVGIAAPPALPVLRTAQWLAPYPAHGTLPDDAWRIGRVHGHPGILVVEFPNLLTQGAAMNRIAALIEKAGAPRDRIVRDDELQALMLQGGANAATFYEGNDYRAPALARFFDTASREGVALRPQEARLLRVLLDAGVLRRDRGTLRGGAQALITFSATQPDDPTTIIDEQLDAAAQASIFEHELSHGVFFTEADYRAHCWWFWRHQLTRDERAQWRSILGSLGYDAHDEELMVNETQAMLMHTPDRRAFDPADYGLTRARLDSERARFDQRRTLSRVGGGV